MTKTTVLILAVALIGLLCVLGVGLDKKNRKLLLVSLVFASIALLFAK